MAREHSRSVRWLTRRGLVTVTAAALGMAILPLAGVHASTPPTTTLTSNVAHLGASVVATAAPAADQPLNIGILLNGQDPAGEAQFLRDLTTPGTAAYGHPLTPPEFDARFGVAPGVGAAVRQWLTGGGLVVPGAQPLASQYVLATGTTGSVSQLLGVHLGGFKVPNGAAFVANLDAPTVPANLGISRVIGLNTSVRFHTLASTPNPPIGIAANPSDLWTAYNQPTANTGQGQQVSTLLWGSMQQLDKQAHADLLAFEDAQKLPHVPLTFVTQDGYVDPTAAADTLGSSLPETDIDAQASTGMAPNVSALTMYYAQDNLAVDLSNALQKWLTDPKGALQMSASFGGCETLDYALEGSGLDAGFARAVAEGRTVFAASGDNGAGCLDPANAGVSPVINVSYPAASPYVVAVGGTVVTETAHNSPTSEYAWNGSGGGTSFFEAAPPWQSKVSVIAGRCVVDPNTVGWPLNNPIFNWANNLPVPPTGPPPPPPTDPGPLPSPANNGVPCRGVPDVAALSGDLLSGYNIVVSGASSIGAGTSLSAPLWQGMWARLNAAAPLTSTGAAPGKGFAAPLLYDKGTGPNFAQDFNDITFGQNQPFPATPGWDFVTGFGSPNLTNLMTDLDGGITPTNPGPPPAPGGSGGGGGSGGASTPCTTHPQIADPGGDATQLAVVDTGQPAISQDDLDIRTGDLSWDQASATLTAKITVTNLNASPPNGQPTNEFFRYLFGATGSWELQASRTPTATTFSVQAASLNGASAAVTGSFDTASNTITITMPAAALASISGPTLKSGDNLAAMSIDGQRHIGNATLTADTASTSCVYTLP